MPKQHSERWEAERAEFEAALRAQENVTAEGVTMAVSLDGVMVPMKEGDAEGKELVGPRGYQEVGCGAVSFYDAEGNRLLSRRRHGCLR